MKNKPNKDKEMAELFYNLYIGCLQHKINKEQQNSSKKINCNEHYEQFKFFAEKYVDSKEHKP